MERVIAKKYQLARINGAFVENGKILLGIVKTRKNIVEENNVQSYSTGIIYEIDEELTEKNNIELEKLLKNREEKDEMAKQINTNFLSEVIKKASQNSEKVIEEELKPNKNKTSVDYNKI